MVNPKSKADVVDQELIKRVEELRAELKEATTKLNTALTSTQLYEKLYAFSSEQKIPDKAAKSQALKSTLEYFKKVDG